MLHGYEEPGVLRKMCIFKSWQSQRRKKKAMRFDNEIDTNVKIKQMPSKIILKFRLLASHWESASGWKEEHICCLNGKSSNKQVQLHSREMGSITLCAFGGMELGFG